MVRIRSSIRTTRSDENGQQLAPVNINHDVSLASGSNDRKRRLRNFAIWRASWHDSRLLSFPSSRVQKKDCNERFSLELSSTTSAGEFEAASLIDGPRTYPRLEFFGRDKPPPKTIECFAQYIFDANNTNARSDEIALLQLAAKRANLYRPFCWTSANVSRGTVSHPCFIAAP